MIKSIANSLFAVLLFALGAAGSWYFTEYLAEKESVNEEQLQSPPSPVLPREADAATDRTTAEAAAAKLPVPFHGRAMSAAEVFRYASVNRKTMETLRQKEEELRQEELRLQLVQKDIEGRKLEIEGVLRQTQTTLEAGERLLSDMQIEAQNLAKQRELQQQELENVKEAQAPSAERMANVKVTAGWLESMSPEDAAETLKNLANNGKMDLALQLLSYIEQRDVAKILDALNDPTLVAELTEGFREITRPRKKRIR